MAKKIDFDRINRNLDHMATVLPILAANAMLNHSKQAFRDQGFTDSTLSPWAPRKRPNKADRNTSRTRALLIDSGNLRRSYRIRKASFQETAVGSYGVPYASRHNQGLNGMPKRQTVGKSKVLNDKLERIAMREFKKVFET
jgi:phage gpG-like protein